MPERTAVVRRVAELVEGRGDVAVVGPACPWRDDLVALLAEWLPGVTVRAYAAVPTDVGATVWLELSEQEADVQRLKAEWEASGRRARGLPLVQDGQWVAAHPDQLDEEPPALSVPDVDVVFVPVSGVRPPRRVRLFWDWCDHVLWDDDYAFLGELEDLLPMPETLRTRLKAWAAEVDRIADADPPRAHPAQLQDSEAELAVELAAALGPEFVVET